MGYNEWLDIDVLEDYLDGKLDARTMHQIERISLEDPFVAEALAGLSQSPKRTQTLSLLQQQLEARIAQKPLEEKRWRITSQRLSIAAAAAVLFITVSILFWMKGSKGPELTQKQVEKQMEGPQLATTEPESKSLVPPAVKIDKPQLKLPTLAKNNAIQASPKDNTLNAPVAAAAKAPAVVADTVRPVVASAALAEVSIVKESGAIASNRPVPEKKTALVRERALAGKVPGIVANTAPTSTITQPVVINGRVVAKADGQPLPGAVVRVPGTNKAAVSNSRGEFSLTADSAVQSLSISYLGYASKEVKANRDQPVNVALEASAQAALKEAMVTTAEAEPNWPLPEFTTSSAYYPSGGWHNYYFYLASNNELKKAGATGKVVALRFEVRPNGDPTKIMVSKSQGRKYDLAAIRLLKDGPKWLPVKPNRQGTGVLEIQF